MPTRQGRTIGCSCPGTAVNRFRDGPIRRRGPRQLILVVRRGEPGARLRRREALAEYVRRNRAFFLTLFEARADRLGIRREKAKYAIDESGAILPHGQFRSCAPGDCERNA